MAIIQYSTVNNYEDISKKCENILRNDIINYVQNISKNMKETF